MKNFSGQRNSKIFNFIRLKLKFGDLNSNSSTSYTRTPAPAASFTRDTALNTRSNTSSSYHHHDQFHELVYKCNTSMLPLQRDDTVENTFHQTNSAFSLNRTRKLATIQTQTVYLSIQRIPSSQWKKKTSTNFIQRVVNYTRKLPKNFFYSSNS